MPLNFGLFVHSKYCFMYIKVVNVDPKQAIQVQKMQKFNKCAFAYLKI